MSRETELRAAIRADPEDDGPRLVYADMLAERDDPRGEFIQLQLGVDDNDDRDGREKVLLARYGDLWAREAGLGGGAQIGWRRGFPYALIGEASAIVACRGVMQREPITELSITRIQGNAGGISQLAKLPELAQIRWLRLESTAYGVAPQNLIPLWSSDEFAQLRTLELVGNIVDDARAPLLANATWFAQLERLALSRIAISAAMSSRLIDHLPKLTALDIRNCTLGSEVAARIAVTSAPLRQLWLDGCGITMAGARALFGSRLMTTLERLAIGTDQLQATVGVLAENNRIGCACSICSRIGSRPRMRSRSPKDRSAR